MAVSAPHRIADVAAAHALFHPLAAAAVEIAAFAYLDANAGLLGLRHSCGAHGNAVDVEVRRVVGDALAFDAVAVVMAHNHPSGDPRPSAADRETTRRLRRALEHVDVRLVDHIILARGGLTSFRAIGWL
ncbi:JAB domain-containing protein [Sphingomonas sp. TDK1]|uniref:JAB domain-containing protein n=1 Tax=Sphingomonas sp. TDK1 TaxID=453247 RepID=UPI0007DA26E4|nr:JAB domain-containing protein [Sphingomonas sp. TDK1]OAN58884.1 DNA repair protein [Sphingomonas sp. TDK1]